MTTWLETVLCSVSTSAQLQPCRNNLPTYFPSHLPTELWLGQVRSLLLWLPGCSWLTTGTTSQPAPPALSSRMTELSRNYYRNTLLGPALTQSGHLNFKSKLINSRPVKDKTKPVSSDGKLLADAEILVTFTLSPHDMTGSFIRKWPGRPVRVG